jgi:hypothetical protein
MSVQDEIKARRILALWQGASDALMRPAPRIRANLTETAPKAPREARHEPLAFLPIPSRAKRATSL